MKNAPDHHFTHYTWLEVRRLNASAAFTLTELAVVIAGLGILFVVLLPALAGSKSQTRIAACAARFRQWAVSANLYANDHRKWLPSGNPAGGGALARDVGTNLVDQLVRYNLTVHSWFDPVRPAAWNAYVAWVHQNYPGQSPANAGYLRLYLSRTYPQECTINDNYWVPRKQGNADIPTDYSTRPQFLWPSYIRSGMPTCALYGWTGKLHDIAAAHVPFVSDLAGSGQGGGLNSTHVGPNVTDISPNTAHFVNGQLIGVNLAFVDGRVENHNPSQMRCVYSPNGQTYWFY